jgi:hypothetical protein
MESAGFDRATITEAVPFEATRRMVQRYKEASAERLSALGFVYGTEVADLAMVGGLGAAVRRVSGLKELPWVDIHVLQEPDHVEQASEALESNFSEAEIQAIEASAEEMWSLWSAFFDQIQKVMFEAPVAVGA